MTDSDSPPADESQAQTDSQNRVTDPAAIDVSLGDVSVFVRGGPDDSIDDVRGHFDEILPDAVAEYVEHRDNGDFY